MAKEQDGNTKRPKKGKSKARREERLAKWKLNYEALIKGTIQTPASQGLARIIILQQPNITIKGAYNRLKMRMKLLQQIGKICSPFCANVLARVESHVSGEEPFCFLAIFANHGEIDSVCQNLRTANFGDDVVSFQLQTGQDEDMILGKTSLPRPNTTTKWRTLSRKERQIFRGNIVLPKDEHVVDGVQNKQSSAHASDDEASSSDESSSMTTSNQNMAMVSRNKKPHVHPATPVTNVWSNLHTAEEYVPPPAMAVAYENTAIAGLSLTLNESPHDDYEPPGVDLTALPHQSNDKVNNEPITLHENHITRMQLTDSNMHDGILQVRYFGISNEGVIHCLCCGAVGHSIKDCRANECETCGAVDHHFQAACPLNIRCSKCREVGHDASVCSAKLKLSATAGDATCLMCAQRGHFEDVCPSIWTTFTPDVSQGRPIQPMCYQCGSSRHWGDDCPMRNRRAEYASDTFSLRYACLVSPDHVQPVSTHRLPEPNSDENDDDFNFLNTRKLHQKPKTGISMNISLNNALMNKPTQDSYSPNPPPPPLPSSTNPADHFVIRGRASDPERFHSWQTPGTSTSSHYQPSINTNRAQFQPPLPDEPPPPFFGGDRDDYRTSSNYRPHPLPPLPSRRVTESSYRAYRGRRN
jgi:hypothetical protein